MFPQFFSVFVMALLSVTIYSGMESVWTGMEHVSNQFYHKTNLCDAWVYGSQLDNDEVEKIKGIGSVTKVTHSMSLVMDVDLHDTNVATDLDVITISDDKNQKPLIMSGEKFDYEASGIWLDQSYAKSHNIQEGDTINISYGNASASVKVNGLVLSPEFIYYTGSATETMPNAAVHGYGYCSEFQIKDILGTISYNQIRISVENDYNPDDLKDEVTRVLGDKFYYMQTRDDFTSTAQMADEISQTMKMALLFTFVFILLALLTMYTTMSRLVKNQITQIGTMKALGLKNSEIRRHYLMYGFIIPLIGGTLGVGLGKVTVAKAVASVKKTTLTLPEWKLENSYGTYFIIALIILICTFATLWAANKSLKAMPAETMRGIGEKQKKRKAPKRNKSNELGYAWTWVTRDTFRNKVRYLIGVIGVAGSMMLMIAGVGMHDSIGYSNDYVFDTQYNYAYKGSISLYNHERYDLINEKVGANNLQWMKQSAVDIMTKGGKVTSVVTIMENGNYIYLEDIHTGTDIKLTDKGIVISNKLAKQLKVDTGDEITFNVSGISKSFTEKIAAITMALTPQSIYISDIGWKNMGETFEPTAVLMDKDTYDSLKNTDYFRELTSINRQKENIDELSNSCNTIIKLLILASFLLSVVILYNLGMVNYEERYREYATMKVMGFTRREIRNIVLVDCALTTIPGWIIGIPAGYAFLRLFIQVVSFDSYDWVMTLYSSHLAIISIFVIACSVIVNLVISHKVQKIIMTEALKSVD